MLIVLAKQGVICLNAAITRLIRPTCSTTRLQRSRRRPRDELVESEDCRSVAGVASTHDRLPRGLDGTRDGGRDCIFCHTGHGWLGDSLLRQVRHMYEADSHCQAL